MKSPTRIAVLIAMVALPVGALVACGAGDEIAYTKQAGTGVDSGIVPDEAGRLVGEGGVIETRPANDGGGVPPPLTVSACAMLDPDGGCDPTAGLGCCLSGDPKNPSFPAACVDLEQYTVGNYCEKAKDVFIACRSSDSDNVCCWGPGAGNTMIARFRPGCFDGGYESCDPSPSAVQPVCPNTGGGCTPVSCHGIDVGYCGAEKRDPCPL